MADQQVNNFSNMAHFFSNKTKLFPVLIFNASLMRSVSFKLCTYGCMITTTCRAQNTLRGISKEADISPQPKQTNKQTPKLFSFLFCTLYSISYTVDTQITGSVRVFSVKFQLTFCASRVKCFITFFTIEHGE